jgi:fucose 4-O-acetylase-like acetyltransferase
MDNELGRKRIEYLDTAKGLLILLVVFGHALLFSGGAVTEPYSYIMKAVYSFHMTAFFLISGFLFNREKWCGSSLASFAGKRALRLMIPYFFFEITGAAVHRIFSWGEPDSVREVILNILSQKVYTGADWYLPTLFLGEMLAFCCLKYLHRNVSIAAAAAVIGAAALAQGHIGGQALCILSRSLLCTSLLLTGFYTKSFFLSAKSWLRLSGAFLIWILSSQLNSLTFLHAPTIGNPVLFLLSGICGTYFILGVSEKVHVRFLEYLGRNTLPVMGTHQNFEHLIAYFWGTSASAAFILISFLIMFLPQLVLVPLMNRFCPFLIGRAETGKTGTDLKAD